MIYILFVGLLHPLVCTLASAAKSKSVNLNLETVLEFDKKNLDTDVQIIDNVQRFLAKVKNVLDKTKNYRRSYNNDNAKFTDFLQSVLVHLLAYSDRELEKMAAAVDDELRKYHYKGCKFYELVQNSDFRRFVTDLLEEMKQMKGKKMKKLLVHCLKTLQNRDLNEKDLELLNYIDSLYRIDAKDKMNNVLESFEKLSKTSPQRRSHSDLVDVIRKGIRSVIFDHYSNLNPNARKDLRMKIANYFITYETGDEKKKARPIYSDVTISEVDFKDGTTIKRLIAREKRAKKTTTKKSTRSFSPNRDLEKEKKMMPLRFISLYAEEIPTTTVKIRTKKTKKRSRHHHTHGHSLDIVNYFEKPDKKEMKGVSRPRSKTIMVVREDRPLREILTEHNAIIRLVNTHSTNNSILKMKSSKKTHRKRKHSHRNKSTTKSPRPSSKLSTFIEDTDKEDTFKATTVKEIELKRQTNQQRKSLGIGLAIESFEDNILDGQYIYRKQNLDDNFTGQKRSEMRKREKEQRARHGYRKNLLLDGVFIKDMNKTAFSSNVLKLHKEKIKTTTKHPARRHKHKSKKHKHLKQSKHDTLNKKNKKLLNTVRFRAQSSSEKVETTTISYVSDNYLINKIHKLEKKLEVVLDKMDKSPDNATVKTTTENNSLPITIVNRDKIYTNIETTAVFPRIPFWKGTPKTTRVISSSSSSEESDKETTGNVTVSSIATEEVKHTDTTHSEISITTKTLPTAETKLTPTFGLESDEHGHRKSFNTSTSKPKDETVSLTLENSVQKAVRSFVGSDDMFSQENGTNTITKDGNSTNVKEKSSAGTKHSKSTTKDGRKLNKGEEGMSTKKYSNKYDKTNAINSAEDVILEKKDGIPENTDTDATTNKKYKKSIKDSKDSVNDIPISTNKNKKASKASSENVEENLTLEKKSDASDETAKKHLEEAAIFEKKYEQSHLKNTINKDNSNKITSSKNKLDKFNKVTKHDTDDVTKPTDTTNAVVKSNEEHQSTKKENTSGEVTTVKMKSEDNSTKNLLKSNDKNLESKPNQESPKLSKLKLNSSKINETKDEIPIDEANADKNNTISDDSNTNLTTTKQPTTFEFKFKISSANMNISRDNEKHDSKNGTRRSSFYSNPENNYSFGSNEEELKNKRDMDLALYNWA